MITTHTPAATPAQAAYRRARGWTATMLGRAVYGLVAFPAGLAGLLATPFGGARHIDRMHRALARRLLGVPVFGAAAPADRQVLRYGLVSMPASLVSFALLGPAWAVFMARGVLYPIFGADNLARSWGGPSLAGAWLAHFIQGPPLLLVLTLLLWPVSQYQVTLARRHFAGRPRVS